MDEFTTSTPDPVVTALVAGVLRHLLTLLGGLGLGVGIYSDSTVMVIAGALVGIVMGGWSLYQKFAAARAIHAAAVQSANAGRPMRLALIAVLCVPLLGLGACALPIPNVVPMPPEVQTACTIVQWAVPVAERFRDRLTPAERQLLSAAEGAVSDCAKGDATAAIVDVALAIEQFVLTRGVARPAGLPALRR